jgi:ribonuclease Z
MPKLVILGTSNAIPDESHDNTHMALVSEGRTILIDCVNNPIVRLQQAGLDLFQIKDIILTHFHPDHVSGVPALLMNSWLLGRKEPLRIYGLAHTLDRLKNLMDAYDWESWPNFFPVDFHYVLSAPLSPVLEDSEYRISASPVHHLVPTIGLRLEMLNVNQVLAYSCDTEPCKEVVELASGADVLIHEATGKGIGHSSAEQAGSIARQAEVGRLLLIHYPNRGFNPSPLVDQAKSTFLGKVELAQDLMSIEFL